MPKRNSWTKQYLFRRNPIGNTGHAFLAWAPVDMRKAAHGQTTSAGQTEDRRTVWHWTPSGRAGPRDIFLGPPEPCVDEGRTFYAMMPYAPKNAPLLASPDLRTARYAAFSWQRSGSRTLDLEFDCLAEAGGAGGNHIALDEHLADVRHAGLGWVRRHLVNGDPFLEVFAD